MSQTTLGDTVPRRSALFDLDSCVFVKWLSLSTEAADYGSNLRHQMALIINPEERSQSRRENVTLVPPDCSTCRALWVCFNNHPSFLLWLFTTHTIKLNTNHLKEEVKEWIQ